MSKWVNKEAFDKFQGIKKEEQENQPPEGSGLRRSDFVWKTPEKGTADKPKIYEGRFLQDSNGVPYKRYYYHMFRSGDKWIFLICPKTDEFTKYCPWCSVVSQLYRGTPADKKAAAQYKRKEKFVGNFYVADDPRDVELEDDDKSAGKVKLYEFPGKVEALLKEEIVDTKHGLGYEIFDPSDSGYNFILKVGATKRDQNGMIWPDYSMSGFARKPSALGTEKEIEDIMEHRFDLEEYVTNLKRDDEFILQTLKGEHLFDYVKSEWERHIGAVEDEPKQEVNSSATAELDEIDTSDIPDTDDDDISDDELLKELDGM